MQIEVGKYYKTRDGRTVGPIHQRKDADEYNEPFMWQDDKGGIWAHDGEDGNAAGRLGTPTPGDLIAPAYPEQGTLKEIGAKQGDTVVWIGCGERVKHFVTEICGTEAILLEDGDDPSERFEWPMDSEYRTWRIISRAPESPTSPIRTVTRTTKEIVPGVYGAVEVYNIDDGDQIGVTMDCGMSPTELRAAAITLNELAGFLEG